MDYKTAAADKNTFGYKLLRILKNVALSYVATLILLLIFAFLFTYTEIPVDCVSPAVFVITLFSVMFSAVLTGRNAQEKGWLVGLMSGFVYMVILYILGSIFFADISFNINGILMIFCGMFFGAIGGIIGINNKKRTRR